jgi:hypothetical protein
VVNLISRQNLSRRNDTLSKSLVGTYKVLLIKPVFECSENETMTGWQQDTYLARQVLPAGLSYKLGPRYGRL